MKKIKTRTECKLMFLMNLVGCRQKILHKNNRNSNPTMYKNYMPCPREIYPIS